MFHEEVEFSTANMTTQQQKDGNKVLLEKRDKLAKDMWVDYCAKYHGGDETEIGMHE